MHITRELCEAIVRNFCEEYKDAPNYHAFGTTGYEKERHSDVSDFTGMIMSDNEKGLSKDIEQSVNTIKSEQIPAVKGSARHKGLDPDAIGQANAVINARRAFRAAALLHPRIRK